MKFIWKIENFSLLKCESFRSPSFSSHSGLTIFPNFDKPFDYIKIELQRLRTMAVLNYSFALLDSEGTPFRRFRTHLNLYDNEDEFNSEDLDVSVNLIKRRDLFGSRKTEYLPNDVLTLQCCIWKTNNELPLSIFARTRVETENVIKKFDLNIPEASLFVEHFRHKEPMMNGEFLKIRFFIDSLDNFFWFCIDSCSLFNCNMEIKILLTDYVTMKKVLLFNKKCYFDSKELKSAHRINFSRNMITSDRNRYLSNDILTVHFICSFSDIIAFNQIVDEDEVLNIPRLTPTDQISQTNQSTVSPPCCPTGQISDANQSTVSPPCCTIAQSLQEVLDEGFLSDFNLKAGDRMFPVHKVILGMRSRVFRAMLTSDMKEKEDNFVNLPDIDEDTLQRMLEYVYSDRLDEDMDCDEASSLYVAADKYALESLKQKCSPIIISKLCVSNVLDVLSLADMYQDQGLKSEVLAFILVNDEDIVNTKRWGRFEKENPKLALDTFHFLYVKKMND